jgi:acyl-CoA thioesterase YciA
MTKDIILTIDKITMVCLDEEGKPTPHGKTVRDLNNSNLN